MSAAHSSLVGCLDSSPARSAESQLKVWVYDPCCRTPWYTAALTAALVRRGHAIRLVCPSYIPEPDYFLEQGLLPRPGITDLARFTAFRKLGQPARLAEYLLNTAYLQIGGCLAPPHILHLQQCVLLERGWRVELALLRNLQRQRVRVVHTVHNLLPHSVRPFHEPLYRELYHLADALICHDDETASELSRRFQISRERLYVVPHGPLFGEMPAWSQSECREALGLPLDSRIFLALGVLAPYKGLDILLEAWANLIHLVPSHPLPVLMIAGNGPPVEKRALERLAGKLGLSGASLRLELHYLPASQIPRYQQAADVLLYPYCDITTSGALLTGLNYCKPIIASQLPPFRNYLFPGKNALLVRPGHPEELAQALQTMMEPSYYAHIKANCARNPDLLVQWSEISSRVTDVYRAILP